MEYREKQFSVVVGINGAWKWSVDLGDGRTKFGAAHTRLAGIKAAEKEIDRALVPKKIRLLRPEE
jgi:hypothetical protein